MAQVNIQVPDYWLEWIDNKALIDKVSRAKLLREAIKSYVQVPDLSPADPGPTPPKASDSWPIKDKEFICPECQRNTTHCGGGARFFVSEDDVAKVRRRWVCVCPACKDTAV